MKGSKEERKYLLTLNMFKLIREFVTNSHINSLNYKYDFVCRTCYNMSTQRSPFNWSEQLYQKHGEVAFYYSYYFLTAEYLNQY